MSNQDAPDSSISLPPPAPSGLNGTALLELVDQKFSWRSWTKTALSMSGVLGAIALGLFGLGEICESHVSPNFGESLFIDPMAPLAVMFHVFAYAYTGILAVGVPLGFARFGPWRKKNVLGALSNQNWSSCHVHALEHLLGLPKGGLTPLSETDLAQCTKSAASAPDDVQEVWRAWLQQDATLRQVHAQWLNEFVQKEERSVFSGLLVTAPAAKSEFSLSVPEPEKALVETLPKSLHG